MFSGIIEHIGEVIECKKKKNGTEVKTLLCIGNCLTLLENVFCGDSISTNGVCLTVVSIDEKRTNFTTEISPETLSRTNFSELKPGSKVNLEKALLYNSRVNGHFVQGHVDTTATIVSIEQNESSVVYEFKLNQPKYIKYIVEKSYIAVDGISLTVILSNIEKATFSLMLISFTQKHVTLSDKHVNETVNIEVDFIAKQIDSLVQCYMDSHFSNINLSNEKKN